jgi:pyruvate kinase
LACTNTLVLESLVKNGIPSRGEMTDAAMAERDECVMLNSRNAKSAQPNFNQGIK